MKILPVAIGIASLIALHACGRVRAVELEANRPMLLVVVAYQGEEAKGAQTIALAANLSACQAAAQEYLAETQPKKGVTLAALCTPIPPAPATRT